MAEIKQEVESDDVQQEIKQEVGSDAVKQPIKSENGVESNTTENGTEDKVKNEKCDEEKVSKTAEEEGDPNLEAKIVRQIEYYFGNINLPRDKFLQEQIKVEDGWVPLDVMLRFNRLTKLSTKNETICAALKSSSQLMEVSEDGTKIRRLPSKPLPENTPEAQKELAERTVYCKGFPQTGVTVDDLIEFFKPYGPAENVSMRNYKDKKADKWVFKGSVFVVFSDKESAEKFLALEKVVYEGTELIRKAQEIYFAEKKKERCERWGKKVPNKPQGKEEEKPKKKEFPKGCILHLSGIEADIKREDVKALLIEMGADVAYIQYDRGDKEGWVRLHSESDGAATKFLKKVEESGKKVKIEEKEVAVRVIEGEEEEQFLDKTRAQLEMSRQNHQNKHRGGRQGWKGGRGRGNKRSRSPAGDGPTPAKRAAKST